MMYKDKHLTKEGFQKILELRETLNNGIGRKRKYTLQNVTSEESSETTRKTDSNQYLESTI